MVLRRELIWVHGYDDRKIGPIHDLKDITISEELQADEFLDFQIRADDPKKDWVKLDCKVTYANKIWRIKKLEDERSGTTATIKATAHPIWTDLAMDAIAGKWGVTGVNPTIGLQRAITEAGSTWTIASAPTTGSFSLDVENSTLLEFIRSWAKVCLLEVYFDTINKTITLTETIGTDRGVGFRYRHNLREIKRTYEPPTATRLIPRGSTDRTTGVELTIASVNSGREYIEDLSWYTGLGLTEADARTRFGKTVVFSDSKFFHADKLKAQAQAQLNVWAQPTLSYEAKVIDLTTITQLPWNDFAVGDTVRVYDATLGIDVRTRVTKLVRKPLQPQNNEIELAYSIPGIMPIFDQEDPQQDGLVWNDMPFSYASGDVSFDPGVTGIDIPSASVNVTGDLGVTGDFGVSGNGGITGDVIIVPPPDDPDGNEVSIASGYLGVTGGAGFFGPSGVQIGTAMTLVNPSGSISGGGLSWGPSGISGNGWTLGPSGFSGTVGGIGGGGGGGGGVTGIAYFDEWDAPDSSTQYIVNSGHYIQMISDSYIWIGAKYDSYIIFDQKVSSGGGVNGNYQFYFDLQNVGGFNHWFIVDRNNSSTKWQISN